MEHENETVFVDDADVDSAVDVVDDTAIDSDWYEGVAGSDTSDDETEPEAQADADPQDAEAQETPADTEAPEQDTDTDDKANDKAVEPLTFTLKHLDEVRTVGQDEVVTLAQKGLDYDRIRSKYDELKAQSEQPNDYERFVREIAERSGMTAEQMIDDARAQVIAEREGIDKAVAVERLRVKRELEAKGAEKAQAETKPPEADPEIIAQQQAQARRDREVQEFFSVYKGVDPTTVPKEVWEDVAKGITLVNAYQAHLNREAVAKIEAEKKAAENARKSTGSRGTAGAEKSRDQIETDWYTD